MIPCVQVCVSECPTMNEFGVRSNPVCVDSVNTTPFTNITSIDFLDINSVSSAADSALVSLGLNRVYSVYNPAL